MPAPRRPHDLQRLADGGRIPLLKDFQIHRAEVVFRQFVSLALPRCAVSRKFSLIAQTGALAVRVLGLSSVPSE